MTAGPALEPDFRAVFEASPRIDLLLAPDAPRFTMLAVSAGRLAATLTTREATVGRPLFDVFADANPGNAAPVGVASIRASLETVLRTKAAHRMTVVRYDIQGPDGRWEERHWVPFNVPVLGPDGEVHAILHQVEDVTERVRAEADGRDAGERLGAALAAARMGTFRWNLDDDTLELDENLDRLLGLPPGRTARTLAAFLELVHPEDRPAVEAACARATAEGADVDVEYRVRRPDGTVVWLHDRGRIHRDDEGRPRYMTGACVEIGARKAAEAALRGAKEAAEEAARLKSEFLATMSHEFRTPLNAILGYAQLLDMGVLGATTAAQHAHLERLQTSGRHLLQLVDDVLDVAKVDADRLAVRHEVLPTSAVVSAALALVQPQATAKGIRVLDLGAPGPGVPYVGDEHRARQVLINLLSNAVKFTPPGGQITVSCGAVAEPEPGVQPGGPGVDRPAGGAPPASWAFVRVEDTGPGIAPELVPRLFEPFVQGDGALTREQGGTGLGLAISRRLARLMGGDLVARSRPGTGATFTLWLPGAASTEPADAAGGTTTAAAPADPARPPRRTPLGVPAIPAPGAEAGTGETAGALDAPAYAVLHALGIRLAAGAELVAERYVAALRADGRFPGAAALPDVQLRDHAAPGIGLLATRLMTVGETRGEAVELLGDGAEVERVMAELHGAQRHRLGWREADIEREAPLLLGEIERAIRGAVDTAATAGGAFAAPPATPAEEAAVRAASRFALHVARAAVEQSTRTAVRAYRFAKAATTP